MYNTRKHFLLGFLLLFAQALCAQPETTSAQQNPTEKTRRFLVRYMNYMDTTSTDDSKEKILKGIEMVANTAKSDWISQYQAAYYNILMAESHRQDSSTAVVFLSEAENYIKSGLSIAPDEGELKTLDVFLKMTKAGIPGPPTKKTIAECIKDLNAIGKANPTNPRTVILSGECQLLLPEKEGRDKKKATELLETGLKKLETDNHEDPAWPRWGKERAEGLLKTARTK